MVSNIRLIYVITFICEVENTIMENERQQLKNRMGVSHKTDLYLLICGLMMREKNNQE